MILSFYLRSFSHCAFFLLASPTQYNYSIHILYPIPVHVLNRNNRVYDIDQQKHYCYLFWLIERQAHSTKVLSPNRKETPLRLCQWMGKQKAKHQF